MTTYPWSNVKYAFMYQHFLETEAGLWFNVYEDTLLCAASHVDDMFDEDRYKMLKEQYILNRRRALEAIMDAIYAKSE